MFSFYVSDVLRPDKKIYFLKAAKSTTSYTKYTDVG